MRGVEEFENNIDTLAYTFRGKDIKTGELDYYMAYKLLYSKHCRSAAAVIRMLLIYPEAGHLHIIFSRTHELLIKDRLALSSKGKVFQYVDHGEVMAVIHAALKRGADLR